MPDTWLTSLLLATLFGGVGWLLSNKDRKQGEEIASLRADLTKETEKREAVEGELYRLHNLDAQALLKVELEITRAQHADPRFTSLENTFKEGFRDLGTSIRDLMQDHVANHHQKGGQ